MSGRASRSWTAYPMAKTLVGVGGQQRGTACRDYS